MKDNFLLIFQRFIRMLGVKVTHTSIEKYLMVHPDDHSLLCYCDALTEWNVEHAALQVNVTQLLELPVPHIAFLHEHGGTFTIITKVGKDFVERFDASRGRVRESHGSYTRQWNGVVLLAEPDENSGEKNYHQKHRAERIAHSRIPVSIIFFALAFTGLIALSNGAFTHIYALSSLFLNVTGLTACVLLVLQSLNLQNSFLQKICNVGHRTSCQNILQSKVAKITEWLTWADVGLLYFSASTLALLLSALLMSNLDHFAAVTRCTGVVAITLSFYGFYYQAKIARMWCPLCLVVMAVCWLQFFLSFYLPGFQFMFSFQSFSIWAIAFALPSAVWLLLKRNIAGRKDGERYRIVLEKVKRNALFFETLLKVQKRMPPVTGDMGVITLGHLDAPHTLTVVADLACTPCAIMFNQIDALLSKTDLINCQYILATGNNENDVGGIVGRKILSLDHRRQYKAIRTWYKKNNRNLAQWENAMGTVNEEVYATRYMLLHDRWIDEAKVDRTPTVYFDGYLLPEMYGVPDLENVVKFYKMKEAEVV